MPLFVAGIWVVLVVPPGCVVHAQSLGGNGVNLQPSYYNSGNVSFGFALMKRFPKIQTVRIEIEPSVPVALARSWIGEAIRNGYKVIATYHKATVLGSNSQAELLAGANWWKANYAELRKAGPFYVNLINEWGDHTLSATAYAQAYNAALAVVRQVYSGKVVIDAPGWGQEAQTVANAITGNGGGTKITDPNIIPSLHIYPPGWNQNQNRYMAPADIDALASAGRSLIVGEFGSEPKGEGDWAAMVKYAKSKGYTVLGWAWNGDGAYGMNMVQPSWSENATATSLSVGPNYFNTIYDLL